MIIPTYEEAFYIATQIERLSLATKVFTSPFATLARLHNKGGAFERLVKHLPEAVIAGLPPDSRPLPTVAPYDELLRRRPPPSSDAVSACEGASS